MADEKNELATSEGTTFYQTKKSRNFVKRFIQWHYRDQPYVRSEKKLESEKYLFWCIPFNRWMLLPIAVLLQFCCGSLYAWSVYNKPLDKAVNGSETAGLAPITFYVAVGVFGLSSAINGPFLERYGPQLGSVIATIFVFAGHLLTALAVHTKQMWLVYVGYGVIGGFGLGFCYISPVSALQKWFPDHRGLASGFAVCGFGAGSIAFGQIPLPLIRELGVPLTFIIMGCIYFVIMMPCAYSLRVPPPGYTVNGMDVYRQKVATTDAEIEAGDKDGFDSLDGKPKEPTIMMTLIESLTSRDYALLYLMFFANSLFGLVVMSRLSNMVVDVFGKSQNVASQIVSANGGFNLAGRLFFSTVSDYVGRKNCFLFTLVCQCVFIGALPTVMENGQYGVFLFMIWIITACYGAGFGVIPAFLTDMFGPKNIGACHGIILTAWAIAGVAGGLIFTAIYDDMIEGDYAPTDAWPYALNFYWILAVAILGFFISLFVRVTLRDRLLPAVAGQIVRMRLFGRSVRLVNDHGLRVELLSKKQEDAEWEQYAYERQAAQGDDKPNEPNY